MTCILSKEDCAEIYHALGCAHAANLQMRIGYKGEVLAKGEARLNRVDAQTIERALKDRHERLLQGAYDSYAGEVYRSGSVTYELAAHIRRILEEIGEMGARLSGVPLRKAV